MARMTIEKIQKTTSSLVVFCMIGSNMILAPLALATPTPTVTIGSQSTVNGASISVPVNATDFGNVGGVTLTGIQFNASLLTYTGYTLGVLPAGTVVNTFPSNRINVNWFDSANWINLNSATLITLNFTVNSTSTTSTNLSFVGANEVSDPIGDLIVGAFTDGVILLNQADPNIDLVAADKAALVASLIQGSNADLSHIATALTNPLPSSGANGSTITWASSNVSVVSNDGQTVQRPDFASGDATVTVTATLTKGSVTSTKAFTLIVLKIAPSTISTLSSSSYTVSAGGSSGTIVGVPFGTPKTTFLAALTVNESHATLNASSVSDPVVSGNTVVVTAQDGTTATTYTVTVAANSAKAITAFTFSAPASSGSIDQDKHTVSITVPFGTNVTALSPSITVSAGASVSPASDIVQDFTTPQTYIVTAANGSTQSYGVTVTVAPNTAKDITSFNIANPATTGTISGVNISLVHIPFDTNITALVPTITITGESVSPASGVAQDFTNPVTYTVTAADGSFQAYTVIIILNPAPPTVSFIANDGMINNSEKNSIYVVGSAVANSLVTVILSDGTNSKAETQQLSSGATAYVIMVDGVAATPASLTDGTVTASVTATNAVGGVSQIVTATALKDTVSPSVTKFGDNSFDVTFAVGDINLVFSEALATSSKSAVESALSLTADKALAYAWSGATLTITATSVTVFDNDVVLSVSDVARNTVLSLLLIDSILDATQTTPNESGSATINFETPQVVITNSGQASVVIVMNGTENPSVDLGSFINDGSGVIPQITITAANAGNTIMAIPAATTVTSADATWNGVIATPTITTVVLPVSVGNTTAVGTAIEVGFAGAKLSFSNAVRLLLPGEAGKKAGYSRTGTPFTEITTVCSADTQASADALPADGECAMSVESDLVIWTKHFTSFATYTVTPIPAVSSGSGAVYIPPAFTVPAPQEKFSIIINGGAEITNTPNVILTFNGGDRARRMALSEKVDFAGASQEPYAATKSWTLSSYDGVKTVYVTFYDENGTATTPISATILLDSRITVHTLEIDTAIPSKTTANLKVYADGQLIRGSDHKVYVVVQGKLKHVLNLKELARYYAGKKISNVDNDVISAYDVVVDRPKKASTKAITY
ncbi:MAG: hypothetical protein Q7S47_01810 [bacterium]|nr:hypothetical protein [bacterium]